MYVLIRRNAVKEGTYATAYSRFTRKPLIFSMKAKYDCARVWTSIHAAHTHIRFSYGLLAVPLVRRDFESAPLFFCRRHPLATKKGGAAK